jgi:hypothetical protein
MELMRGLRNQLSELISGLGTQDLGPMSLGLSHSLSRYKLKFSPEKVSQYWRLSFFRWSFPVLHFWIGGSCISWVVIIFHFVCMHGQAFVSIMCWLFIEVSFATFCILLSCPMISHYYPPCHFLGGLFVLLFIELQLWYSLNLTSCHLFHMNIWGNAIFFPSDSTGWYHDHSSYWLIGWSGQGA